MGNKMRRMAERITLAAMAGLGILVLIAEPLGLLPADVIPKITLLALSTVTLFLLLEVERLQLLDNIDARLSELDIDTIAQKLKRDHYAGIKVVHDRFPDDIFIQHLKSAKEVTILNTWIPNLYKFESSLVCALNREAKIRILLLNPNSGGAQLRDEALRAVRDPILFDNVKDGVKRCLVILESILKGVDKNREAGLEVKLYDSLPSIAVYRSDTHYFVSTFLHGQLAIDSPQFEIDGTDTIWGERVQRELDTLWTIGYEVDFRQWRIDLR